MTKPSISTLLALICVMISMPASAQENPVQTALPSTSDPINSFERAAGVPASGDSSTATPADVKPFDPAAATQAWLDSLSRDQREKSDAYFEGGYWLILWNYLLAAGISIFLLGSRISERLRDFCERVTKIKNLQIAFYAIPYLVLVYALSF